MRLIDYLLAHDLALDERSARGLILRGDVLVDERPVTSPEIAVGEGAAVRVRGDLSGAVSRGAAKLAPAVERSGFECAGRVCLDLGVSTGGFSQVLLERGAARIYAVDVAYGVTALSIRDDPRVVLLERTNARQLSREQIAEPVERVVGDLSFIGWDAVLPAVAPLLAGEAELLLLVKPQFELAARGAEALVAGGVVRDAAAVRECLAGLYNTWVGHGLNPRMVVPAGARGARGNLEYFVYLKAGEQAVEDVVYRGWIDAAVAEAGR